MSDIALPNPTLSRRALLKLASIASLLASALVAASSTVEECWIVPGDFSADFSSRDFDVTRKVCGRSQLAAVIANKLAATLRAAPLR
jgi:hypothetical protein